MYIAIGYTYVYYIYLCSASIDKSVLEPLLTVSLQIVLIHRRRTFINTSGLFANIFLFRINRRNYIASLFRKLRLQRKLQQRKWNSIETFMLYSYIFLISMNKRNDKDTSLITLRPSA